MQEEIEQKTFNLMVSTAKLTGRKLLEAGRAALKQHQEISAPHRQSVRTLLRQNRGVSSVEISKTGIRGFERYAKNTASIMPSARITLKYRLAIWSFSKPRMRMLSMPRLRSIRHLF